MSTVQLNSLFRKGHILFTCSVTLVHAARSTIC